MGITIAVGVVSADVHSAPRPGGAATEEASRGSVEAAACIVGEEAMKLGTHQR